MRTGNPACTDPVNSRAGPLFKSKRLRKKNLRTKSPDSPSLYTVQAVGPVVQVLTKSVQVLVCFVQVQIGVS